jgi:putative DNA primase/helicase
MASNHPYLVTKGVQAFGLKVEGERLLVPVRDEHGQLHSLQEIDSEGGKRFLRGGRVKGCYHLIGEVNDMLVICEGYATGASIHEATGHAVAVAFTVWNLGSVAVALRRKFSESRIIIAADDDWKTHGNPGLTTASRVARECGALLAAPKFTNGREEGGTDFNDLHRFDGRSVVAECIAEAFVPKPESTSDWPELAELGDAKEREEFPLDALPTIIRDAVIEVQAFTQAPMAMVATSALSALSIAAQALYDVKRAENLSGPIALFTLIIADSGERKTTCDNFFLKPIKEWQARQVEDKKLDVERATAELGVWKTQCDGVLAKIKSNARDGKSNEDLKKRYVDLQRERPEQPVIPKLLYSDVTPEELGYQLATSWPSAAISSSEGGTVLGGHSMTGDSIMRNMARLNDIWSGEEIRVDRRTSGSYVASNSRLTVAIQIQESTLRKFDEKSDGLARGTGFWARFLIAWPQSTQGTRFYKEPPAEWPKLNNFWKRLRELLEMPVAIDDGGGLLLQVLTLDPDAKSIWVAYHDEVEKRLADGGEFSNIRDVASKSADNAARLAGLFQVANHASNVIEVDAMRCGIHVAAWYLEESRRFLASEVAGGSANRVLSWLRGRCQSKNISRVSSRELQREGPVRDRARLNEVLEVLESSGYIRQRKAGKRKFIELNPVCVDGSES